MPYKSSFSGKRIKNEEAMTTVEVWDSVAGEVVEKYFNNLQELKDWWLLPEPRPDLGGIIELSSYEHKEIDDEKKKVTISYKGQTFNFADETEAKKWYSVIAKTV